MAQSDSTKPTVDRTTLVLRWAVGVVLGLAVLMLAWLAIAYLATPDPIRHPSQAHYHFRMQLLVSGKPVDFSADKFQTDFNKDNCSAAITQAPIHFHDKLDQFVHIHWDHVTGGILLKNFGWNFIGGIPEVLGYRFEKFPSLTQVSAHGDGLPRPSKSSKYYVYTGDQNSYKQRSWDDFISQDLRVFFTGKTKESLEDHMPATHEHGSEAEKAQLNDVLGSVVIFAQADPPTDAQIKDRFSKLIPLPESACAG